MEGQTSGTTEPVVDQIEGDPWAQAFAALESKGKESAQATDDGDGERSDTDSIQTNDDNVSNSNEEGDGGGNANPAGGLDLAPGVDGSEGSSAFSGMQGTDEESLKQYQEKLDKDIRDRAIREIAEEFVKRGVRNTNGKLGATIDDPDICKRDEDGVPHFFNPETGNEFRSDNPRRQAQEWVEDYNKEIARAFNTACEQYEAHLKKEASPSLEVMRFAPKYNKLDDIRKGMFDNIVEDYEIKDDDGKVIGYSCDLDKALNLVEKQIKMIKDYAAAHQPKQQQQATGNSGPVLDMKTSSGAVSGSNDEPPKSLEEALMRVQNRELEKLKKH